MSKVLKSMDIRKKIPAGWQPFDIAKRVAAVLVVLLVVCLGVVILSKSQAVESSFSFTAAGDHRFNSASLASMDAVKNSGSSFYIALGDLSYAAGKEDEWCAAFKSRFNDVELIAGNHDTGESSGGDINKYRQHCPFTLGKLTGDYGKQYYFDYPQSSPLARFILIVPGIRGSVNINYNVGGSGYNFTKNAIDQAQAAGIKWIVVGMHKNCITVGNKSCDVGTDIMKLLIDEKVDLILQSHDHNYQRSHALKCITTRSVNQACIADSGSDGKYVKGVGPVLIINGEFGASHYSVNSNDSEAGYFAKTDSTTCGTTKYTISDKMLQAQYLRGSGGNFADTFTISSTPTDTTPPPPPAGGAADLVVTAISSTPANPATGQPVTFSATVKNQGGSATPSGTIHGVKFTVNGSTVAWSDTHTTSLAPGASVTLSANSGPGGTKTWTAAAGSHTVLAHVDDINRIPNEADETNNTLTRTITVSDGTTPPPPPPPSPAPGNGDANGDNRVNAIDLSIVLSKDGQNYPAADFNKDGTVGAADMAILLGKWTW